MGVKATGPVSPLVLENIMSNPLEKSERVHAQVWGVRKAPGWFSSRLTTPSHGRAFFARLLKAPKGLAMQSFSAKRPRVSRATIEAVCLSLSAGLTQQAIASELGVSLSTVRKLAKGQEPTQRCPDCGNLVTMPCVECDTRAWMYATNWEDDDDWFFPSLSDDLEELPQLASCEPVPDQTLTGEIEELPQLASDEPWPDGRWTLTAKGVASYE